MGVDDQGHPLTDGRAAALQVLADGMPPSDAAVAVAAGMGTTAGQVLAAEALATVAAALGQSEQVARADSMTEVTAILVAEVARLQTLCNAPLPVLLPQGGGVTAMEFSATTTGTATEEVRGGYHTRVMADGGEVVGIAVHDANPGDRLTIALRPSPAPKPEPQPGGLPRMTNVFEALVTQWRGYADHEQITAGDLQPSQVAEIQRRRGFATALYQAASELADVLEPLRTEEADDA